jgi:hypothetical protein
MTWVTEGMCRSWGVSPEDVEARALANQDRLLDGIELEIHDVDGDKLGAVPVAGPYKASVIFSERFRSFVELELGWPVLVVIPCRDFLFALAEDSPLLSRIGSVVDVAAKVEGPASRCSCARSDPFLPRTRSRSCCASVASRRRARSRHGAAPSHGHSRSARRCRAAARARCMCRAREGGRGSRPAWDGAGRGPSRARRSASRLAWPQDAVARRVCKGRLLHDRCGVYSARWIAPSAAPIPVWGARHWTSSQTCSSTDLQPGEDVDSARCRVRAVSDCIASRKTAHSK